ncbi:MAG TPA: biotin/lipoyl-binding protein, partial [Myxococcota bacterium]|nr:biotin/lipoyl-binding protein [Myxococcota bacterium]
MNTVVKRAIWIGTPTLLLVIAAFGYRGWLAGQQGDESVIRVSGNIEVTDAEVSFNVSGRVEARAVSEGESVRSGDPVARLESTELEQEVALRRAELAAASASLAELQAGSRPEEIARARAALDLARAQERHERVNLERRTELFEGNVISSHEFDESSTAHQVATARVREAEEALRLIRKGPRAEA